MERFGRHELLARGTRLAVGAAAVGIATPALAKSGPPLADLRKALGAGKLLVPGDAGYGVTRVPWNRRYDSVKPLAVALPGSAAGVATCVRWAAKHGVPFAIRGGGHSFAGQSSSKGLVIDLRRLNGVKPGMDGYTARVGAGAKLGGVYGSLWAAGGRTIPAGTAPTVGVAGLTLGGGHGFLTRKLGLACDALVGVEIVTADGHLRTCDASTEKDLFWALRGGGIGSFGVVTALTFATTAMGNVTTVALEWDWAKASEVIAKWTSFMASAPDELSTVLALRVPATAGGTPKLACNGMFVGSKADAQAAIEALVTATTPTKLTLVQRPYPSAVSYFEGNQSEKRRFIGAASGYARAPLSPAGRAALVALVNARHANPGLRGGGAVLFALGGAAGRIPAAKTAFVHRPARFSVELVGLWDTPAASSANLAWIAQGRATMRPHLSGEAVQNYADTGLADWKQAYYGANLARLKKVKKAVDPDNLFRHSQSIPVS
jgi:FAD/FMN-containing dehydrogenase